MDLNMETVDREVERILGEVTKRGMKVSLTEMTLAYQLKLAEANAVFAKLRERFGESYRPHSPADVMEVVKKIDPEYHFKSVAKDFLVPHIERHPDRIALQTWGPLIVKGSELSRSVSVFRNLQKLVAENEIMHPKFGVDDCDTRRIYAEDPALNSWPKLARACVFPDESKQVAVVDWKAQEMRILAVMSEDLVLAKSFEPDSDPHVKTYEDVSGNKCDSPEKRNKGKMINYAIQYGIDAKSLSRRMGCSEVVAQKVIDKFFQTRHGVKRFVDESHEMALANGYVTTMFGSKIEVKISEETMDKNLRQSVNFRIQGSGADLMRIALVEIDRIVKERAIFCEIICPTHDGFVLFMDPDQKDEFLQMIEEAMCVTLSGIKFPVEVQFGDSWGDAMDADKILIGG